MRTHRTKEQIGESKYIQLWNVRIDRTEEHREKDDRYKNVIMLEQQKHRIHKTGEPKDQDNRLNDIKLEHREKENR